METNGSQPPVFETDADRTYLTVILPVHDTFLHSAMQEVQTTTKPKHRKSIKEIKELVVSTLDKTGNLSTSELAAAMGYTKVTATVSKAIKELMVEEKVVYSDPEHPRSRNQKICLIEDHTKE